jgi:hypothetical protein
VLDAELSLSCADSSPPALALDPGEPPEVALGSETSSLTPWLSSASPPRTEMHS